MRNILKTVLSLCLTLTMLTASALGPAALAATVSHSETGERVTYQNGKLSVYDRVVFEAVPKDEPYRGIIINDSPTPLSALTIVLADLLQRIRDDEIKVFRIVALENLVGEETAEKLYRLSILEQVMGLLYVLDLMLEEDLTPALRELMLEQLDIFDYAQEAFTLKEPYFPPDTEVEDVLPADFAQGSIESRYGYLTSDEATGEVLRFPYMNISLEILYNDQGGYAAMDESQRTYIENYNFAWASHQELVEKAWGLFSIIRGVRGYVGSTAGLDISALQENVQPAPTPTLAPGETPPPEGHDAPDDTFAAPGA